MKQLNINPVFRDLIQSLTADEFKQLEDNVLAEGIRDAIVVWNDTIVDGHNRYQLAQKHSLQFDLHEVDFNSQDEAVLWIIDNQLGRRNLTDFVKLELQQKRADVLYEQGRNVMSVGAINRGFAGNQHTKVDGLSIIDKPSRTEPAHNTRNEIAESLNWSTGKVAQGQYVIKHAPEEVKEKLRAGELSMNEAYKAIKMHNKQQQKQEEIETIKQRIEQEDMVQLPQLFHAIVLDPPWNYAEVGQAGSNQYDPEAMRGTTPYPTMSLQEIADIQLPADDDCVLFLWTTHAFLRQAFDLLQHYKFTYKACLVWDKEKMGIGRTVRMQCEFCLIGIKGNPIILGSSERDIIREARREHSRKPDAFYEMVERMVVGRRLDYFSRENRVNWHHYGAEVGKF